MARRNVKVEIPIGSPDEMETLTDAILARHTALGANSPLTGEVDMVALATKHNTTVTKRDEGNDLQADSEADMQAANTAMGTAEGQTIDTPGTVYYLTGLVRDRLMFVYNGLEEELSTYGFNVVITEGSGGTPPLQLFLTLTANQIPLSHLSMGIKGTTSQAAHCSISWGDATTDALTLSGIYQNSAHDYLTEGIYTIEQKSSKPENITGLIGSGGAFNAYASIQLSPLLANLEELNFSGSQFTTISIPIELEQLKIVFLVAGNLDAASVNNLLTTMNGFNTFGGTINISGGTNASPSGQGIAAKNQLLSRGWTVITN